VLFAAVTHALDAAETEQVVQRLHEAKIVGRLEIVRTGDLKTEGIEEAKDCVLDRSVVPTLARSNK